MLTISYAKCPHVKPKLALNVKSCWLVMFVNPLTSAVAIWVQL